MTTAFMIGVDMVKSTGLDVVDSKGWSVAGTRLLDSLMCSPYLDY
jgi:hypothetical protein